MFLTNMGGKKDDDFNAKLLEKAGIKIDTEAKKRDLSPNAADEPE